MRRTEWQQDIDDARRRENWSLTGARRLVKVVRYGTVMNTPQMTRAAGYVTQESYLIGKTPTEIERALGLIPLELQRGCRVFRLARLPQPSEYTYELSAAMPNGLAFNPADAFEARTHESGSPEACYYPPGAAHIPQWRVSVAIALVHLIDLGPVMHYPSGLG